MTEQRNASQRKRRRKLVTNGLCGLCGRIRNLWEFLCDGCAEKHRDRQRAKTSNKKAVTDE